MIQGFKSSQCEWLKDSRLGQNQHGVRHTPPSASKKQKELANEFVFWLFNGFLITLLRVLFMDDFYQQLVPKGLYYGITNSSS
jgi:hypothetical protein